MADGGEAAPGGRPAPMRTRISDLLGTDYPIIQAPMGLIARSQLASAVSRAGGLVSWRADRSTQPASLQRSIACGS